MPAATFFTSEARARAAASVANVESQSAIEVVIAIQRRSGDYRATDLIFGFFCAELVLIGLLFLPPEFALIHFPIDLAVSFGVGAAICANFDPLRRVLSRPRKFKSEVERGARSSFVERGVSRTSGRIGVLIYASLFEGRAALVPDIGVDLEALGEDWRSFEQRLQAATAARDFDAFIAAIESSGPAFARAHPRSENDVNELPDEMYVA